MSAAAATPKAKKAAKPKKPASHPKYNEMIVEAIQSLKERSGSSRQAILKYILAKFNVGKDATAVNARLKMALKRGVVKGSLKQSKGTGASGSFRVGEKAKAAPKKVAKPKKVKTPKKAAKPKKPAGEKKAAKPKKAKSPKKAKAAKPKKAKSPKKAKAAKPKKAKSPKKAAAKKPAAKKAAKPKK